PLHLDFYDLFAVFSSSLGFFFSSRRRHTSSVSAFLLNRSSDLSLRQKWFLENEKTVTQFCRKLAAERPLKDIRDEYNYPKKKGRSEERRVGKECRSRR